MPRCIECERNVSSVVQVESNVIERCPQCGKRSDFYFEFSDVQTALDIFLLHRKAWVHLLFNNTTPLLYYIMIALCGCSIEAYVVHTTLLLEYVNQNALTLHNYHMNSTSNGNISLFNNTHTSNKMSLQLVKLIQQNAIPLSSYFTTLPRLFLLNMIEYVLTIIAAMCVGKHYRPLNDSYEEALKRWVRVVSVAYCAKIGYVLFFIWTLPCNLLPLIDVLHLTWLLRGLLTLTPTHSVPQALIGCMTCVIARVSYRHSSG